MPNPQAHEQAPNVIVGVAGIIYGLFEPTMIVTFLCAILGSGIGLSMLPAPPPDQDKLKRFLTNLAYIVATSIVTMFAMYWISKRMPEAEYPSAFFCSILLMLFRDRVITGIGRLLDRKLDGV